MSHAKYSPSASSRWLSCTASLTIDTSHIKERRSPAAELGTALHQASEAVLRKKLTLSSVVGKTFNKIKITKDHVNGIVKPYINFVKTQCETNEQFEVLSYELHVEVKSLFVDEIQSLDIFHPDSEEDEVYGTGDVVIVQHHPGRRITLKIIDLKTGAGKRVESVGNSQLKMYATGVYLDYRLLYDNIVRIEMGICQPPFDVYSMIRIQEKELLDFHESACETIHKIETGDVEFVPSDSNCEWCPAKTVCPELNKAAQHAAAQDFSKLKKASVKSLSEQLKMVGILKKWMSAVEEEAQRRFEEGKGVKSFKRVHGRSQRTWIESDPEKRKALFRENKIPLKLLYGKPSPLSPFQVEEELKKAGKNAEVVKSLIDTIPGKPIIVPEDDPRESIETGASSRAKKDFEKIRK